MAICSQCQTSLTVPADMVGKWVRCPTCHESFLADESSVLPPLDGTSIMPGNAPFASPKEPSYFEPSPVLQIVSNTLNRRERQQKWERVRSGLRMMYIGLVVGAGSFLAVILVFIGQILVLDLFGPRFVDNPPAFLADTDELHLATFGLLAGAALGSTIYVVGTCICLATPVPRAGLWLAAQQLFLFWTFALAIGMYASAADTAARYIVPLLLFSLAAVGCLAGYLRRLSEFLDNQSLIETSVKYAIFQMLWLPVSFTALRMAIVQAEQFLRALPHNADPPIAGIASWLLLLAAVGVGGGIISLLWTLRMLRSTWQSIHPEKLSNG